MLRNALLCLVATVLPALAHAQVEVQVLDDLHKPIAGASVTTFESAEPARASTDADGRCNLALARSPKPIRMRVEKEGWFHVDSQWLAQPQLQVTLHRAVPLGGRVVVAGSGEAVAKAEVALVHTQCKACEPERVEVGTDGSFRLPAVPLGVELELQVGAPGFPRQKIVLGALSEEHPARTLEIERGYEIHGRVVDFDSGAPIAGATVATVPGKLNLAQTGADGEFHLLALAESFRQLLRFEVHSEGYCELGAALTANEILPGKVLRCPLPKFAAISGVVLDLAGVPVVGADVFLREDTSWLTRRHAKGDVTPHIPFDELPSLWTVASGLPNQATKSDAEGRFRFERVVPWTTDILLQSQHPIGGGAMSRVGPIGASGTTFEARLEPEHPKIGGRLSGTLTLNGEPAQGVVLWKGPTHDGRANVDTRGVFNELGIEPGEVTLTLANVQTRSVLFGTLFKDSRATVQVVLNAETKHDFVLAVPTGTIKGRVRNAAGGVPARVSVGMSELEAQVRAQAVLDAEGNFSVDVPQVGRPWRVVVLNGPQQIEREGVMPGGDPIEVAVGELGSVRLRIFDAKTGANLAPCTVMWRKKGASGIELFNLMLEPVSGTPGWFRAAIPYGEWELGAWPERASYPPSVPTALVVRANENEPALEFALAEGRPLALKLADGSDRPPRDDDGRVWILEADWWGAKRPSEADVSTKNVDLPKPAQRFRLLLFDSSGKAQVPGVRPGRYRFVTASRGDSIEPTEITVTGEESEPIAVRWKRTR